MLGQVERPISIEPAPQSAAGSPQRESEYSSAAPLPGHEGKDKID